MCQSAAPAHACSHPFRPGWRRPPGSTHTPLSSGRRAVEHPALEPRPDAGLAPPLPAVDAVDIAWLMGLEAGNLQGLVAGRRRALLAVLDARFGPLDAAVRQRLRTIEPTALDRRLCDAVRADDLEAFWRADDPARAPRVSGGRG